MFSSKARLIFLGLSILSLVVLIIGAALAWKNVRPITTTLPDGSTVWVRGVLVSTNEFTTDTIPFKMGRRFLPPAWQKWIPASTTGRCGSTDGDEITVYMTRKNAAGGLLSSFWGRVDAVDEHGFAYKNNPGSCSFGNEIIAFSLEAFPRRQETFKVRMYDYQNRLQAELTLPNPIRGPFPEWKPEPLPQTKTNQEVVLTLNGGKVISQKNGHNYCSWSTQLDSADPLWKKYGEVRYFWSTDCTGNNGSLLSPREKTWKAHVQCFRKGRAAFRTNEVWKIENLIVPTNAVFTLLKLSNVVDGIQFQVPVISGSATLTITNDTNWSAKPFARDYPGQEHSWMSSSDGKNSCVERGSDCPFFLIEMDNLRHGTEVLFNFYDVNGKALKAEESPSGYYGDSRGRDMRLYVKRLKIAPGEKISLEIIVNRSRDFEFLVDPKEIKGIEKLLEPPPQSDS